MSRIDLPIRSARIQTVHEDTNPRYSALLSAFERKTSCPVLVNTSFNVRGEPIVCTPEDAFLCFMGTELDALAVGNCYLPSKTRIRRSSRTTNRPSSLIDPIFMLDGQRSALGEF
jgi:hypothetical protein